MNPSWKMSTGAASQLWISTHPSCFHLRLTPCFMFAALILKYSDVTLEIFDDILSLLQRRDFCASDIRFRRPKEYMEHISSQRREIAKTRQSINQRMAVESPQHRNDEQIILLQIVEIVADHIERERTPFQHMTNPTFQRQRCEADSTLRNMALVHRSWTGPAQQRLATRIVARSPSALLRLLMVT